MQRYIRPIYDRTAIDITNKTAKAYFNIADWKRVYNNLGNAINLEEVIEGNGIVLPVIAEPTITTIPTVSIFNAMLLALEELRLNLIGYLPSLTTNIKHDWVAGSGSVAPDYKDVNLWEQTIDIIYNNIGAASGYTGWVADSGSPVRRNRSGVAISGAGLTRNNGFVKYA